LSFHASGLSAAQSTEVSVKISDEFGNEIASTAAPMTADSSGNATATVAAPSKNLGYFRVEATLPDGTPLAAQGTRPTGFITYAVVPDPSARVNYGDSGSRFGMQGGFSAAQGSVIPYLGIRYVLADPAWADLEPNSAGQYALARSAAAAKGQAFPAKDAVTTGVTYNGAAWPTYSVPLVSRAKIPSWALDPGTAGTICKSMGGLNSLGTISLPGFAGALAEEVSTSYTQQSAHYYQITWEPQSKWCYGGSTAQLVEYFKLTYAALHQADAKAVVTGPTLFPGDDATLKELWAAGLGNYVDAESLHPYVKFPPESNGLVSSIRSQMQMAEAAKGHSIPFVATEHGYSSSSIGELNEALGNIRTTIILLGEGFKFDISFYIADFWSPNFSDHSHYYGYYYNLNPKLAYGSDKIAPKPAAPAFAAMSLLLDGSSAAGPVANLTGSQMGYRFQRNGTTILALWDYQAASSTVSVPVAADSAQICTWMDNCSTAAANGGKITVQLGASPTYVVISGS
jgi:hypothetical protein